MNSPRPFRYVHGTAPEEQRRLTGLNDRMNAGSLREAAIRSGDRILDFGAGLAQLTRAMAKSANVRAVGIERSEEQLREAIRQARDAGEEALVDLRRGDALDPPLSAEEWGSFDVTHVRFLLEHVPDPLAIVRTMVRAVRPGGRVILEDEDHDLLRLWPEPPGAEAVWRAYVETYQRMGNDPYVGRKLVALLHQAGAAPRRSTFIFFGSSAGAPDFGDTVENLIGVLEGARDAILDGGAVDAARFEEAIVAIRDWARRPDAAIWFPISWAEGIRPA